MLSILFLSINILTIFVIRNLLLEIYTI
jgi:hypothetical protein